MEIKNCPRCGKIFTVLSSNICPACEKDEEDCYRKVKDYINENPMSSLAKVVEETGVSAKRIQKYIRDGRLEVSKGMQDIIVCESCGRPISRGKYCDSCVVKITSEVDEMFGKRPSDGSSSRHHNPKMHTKPKVL